MLIADIFGNLENKLESVHYGRKYIDKLKNVVHKPKPKPIKPKATKISDINLEKNKREIFTLHDEKDKNKN